MQVKYDTLVRILDKIRQEAPKTLKIYHPKPTNSDALIQARSRAYLHLFLKVKFGLLTFNEREPFVTDGPHDGGLDAYYIDEERKIVYFLQSKFRATASNFAKNQISADDLLKVQVKRILDGEKLDEDGNKYNDKILAFQKRYGKIPDPARYKYQVIILGNSAQLTQPHLKKLCDGFPIDQYNHERAYGELVFPVVNGNYFNHPDLRINISLGNVVQGNSQLRYSVKAAGVTAEVTLLFVPTFEIGRILYTYKNSILRFNPRSFLELSKNPVNQEIARSVTNLESNEFALFNNGITLLSDETSLNTLIAKKRSGQLEVKNPQIVNGAQTAYTLSRLYEEVLNGARLEKIFTGKEVLLRVITFNATASKAKSEHRDKLITELSKASNSQTKVNEADRRSNDAVQVQLQQRFFANYGLFYERKRGEFSDGLRDGYIDDSLLVHRENLMRVKLACDLQVAQARASVNQYFTEAKFPISKFKLSDVDRYAYGYACLRELELLKGTGLSNDRYNTAEYGQALRYGIYAVVGACVNTYNSKKIPAKQAVQKMLAQWKKFEDSASSKSSNKAYFGKGQTSGFVGYYKGGTINDDVSTYKFS